MITDIEKYKYELRRYNIIKIKISEMLPLLEKTSNTYEEIIKSLSNIYLIDGDNTDVYNKSVELKNKTDDTSKKLKNNILPKIESKIYILRKEIMECEENG